MNRSVAFVLAVSLSFPAVASAASPENTCVGKRGESGTFYMSITSGELDRTFRLDVPEGNDPNSGAPVIFNFHGLGGDGDNQAGGTRMPQVAGERGFITVHPDGVDNSWNAGTCCGTAAIQQIDDVQFVRDMLDAISEDYCIDPDRVHSTGFSNGGYLSHRLACEASDIIASVAPGSGLLAVPCAPERPVPIHQSQGTADPLVFHGRALSDIEEWADINGCRQGPDTYYSRGNAECFRYSECGGEAVVEMCSLRFTGHTWPNTRFYDETAVHVEFFEAHPMP